MTRYWSWSVDGSTPPDPLPPQVWDREDDCWVLDEGGTTYTWHSPATVLFLLFIDEVLWADLLVEYGPLRDEEDG